MVGVISPDVVTLTQSGDFDTKNVGTSKAITANCSIGGVSAGNYTLTQPTLTARDITTKALTITATGPTKTYGTALSAGTSATNFTHSGEVNGEAVSSVTLTPNAAGLSASTLAGVAYVVTPSAATGTGFTASNYNISYNVYNGTVGASVPDAPTITGITAGDGQLSVAFTAGYNGGSTITNYKYSTNDGSSFTSAGSTTSPIVITGLTNGTPYNVQLKAVNVNGDGIATTSTSGTPASAAVTVSTNSNLSSYTPTSATDVTVSAGYELTVNADASVKSITVAPGAKLTLGSATLTTTNGVTLQSTSGGSATFVDNNTSSPKTVTGTVEQYLDAPRNWYVTSPVAGATVPTGQTYYSYDETGSNTNLIASATAYWVAVAAGSAINPMKGYITQPGATTTTLNYTGTFNTGLQTVALTRTTGKTKEGFNLVANPYPSYLDFSKVDTTAANILSTIWYRTKTALDAYTFDTYNGKANLATTNGARKVTKMIPPMQAFWVRVKTVAGGTLTFNNDMRAHIDDSGNRLKTPSASNSIQQVVRLQVSNGTNSDEAIVLFNPNALNGFDAYDSPKMSNNDPLTPEIYTIVGTENLVINGMNSIVANKEIPLALKPGTSSQLSIKATELSNLDPGTMVVLRDYQDPGNVVEQDLTNGVAYSFAPVTTATTTSRFALVLKSPSATTGLRGNENELDISVFRNGNGQITLSCPAELTGKATMSVYNALGQKLETRLLTSTVTVLTNRHESGVYFVTVVANGKASTQKVVIN